MTGLLLSYYGDDLTGSTDVMEALSSRGVPTVLFTQPPTPAQRAKFPEARAIGLAGTSRSESPAWMDVHLRQAFAWLKSQAADYCHYKVCSTFDSSPTIGSIGRAIDIGAEVFQSPFVPLVVGAPQLKRYTVFGELFAAYQGQVYRIDRHPVMSKHPVTPMDEADLRIHLGRQTAKSVRLVDVMAVRASSLETEDAGVVMFDVLDAETQIAVGRHLMRLKGRAPFIAGSSGVEYALLAAWAEAGLISSQADFPGPGAVDRIAVVSGSCSPTTARQIRYAEANGFDGHALSAKRLAAGDVDAIEQAVSQGLASLDRGRSVVLYTALGPESDVSDSLTGDADRHGIGAALGLILRRLIERAGLRRAVIAGGDTSGHALRQLNIHALTTLFPLPATPGSPLCSAHSDDKTFHQLQIALKGGQVGGDDYFGKIKLGAP